MDARILHEAIRSATVTYPIPFVFSVLLLFAVLCLGGSMVATEWLRVLLAVLGTGSAVSAIALVAYAIISRPETLRSEQHVLSMRMAQMIGDKDTDPAVRERLSQLVIDAEDRPRPKYPEPRTHHADEDSSNGE
jgi:Na+(H+)/acetate symporter ActP